MTLSSRRGVLEMTFPEFLAAYRAGTLNQDAAWRAYDIAGNVSTRVTSSINRLTYYALKRLGMSYAGELALPEFMARYAISTPEEARTILACWWLWSGIDAGRAMGVPKRSFLP